MQVENKRRWIGIDGGGTKTLCVIGDERGNILSKSVGTSSNIHTTPYRKVKTNITVLIDKVINDSQSTFQQIESIQLCLAGADRDNDKLIIQDLFEDTIYKEKILIKTDAEAALASGTWGESGFILIAGTGSIVYGVSTSTGKTIRYGGWGYLLGDEGSGFHMGKMALKSVLKSYDRRGPKTKLTNLLLKHFNIQQVPELVKIYFDENLVQNIAQLSKYVMEAAMQEDLVAMSILDDSIHELVKLVEAAIQYLLEMDEKVLVLHGGLFSDPYFKNLVTKKVMSVNENLNIVQPEIPAVVGAYLLGIKRSGILIDEKFTRNVRLSWSEINLQK